MTTLRLSLRQLQIFAAIARSDSTAAAGSEIGLSQSATSAALNELERLLSLQLFDRIGKRLLLNHHGRELLPRALALLDSAADIERMGVTDDTTPPALRIGASTTVGNHVLPRLLREYLSPWSAAAGTAWQVRVMVANTAEVCRAVAEFELDIGLIEGPCHEPAIDARPWLGDELVIVAAPELAAQLGSLAAATQQRVPVKALREQVWLLREAGSGTRVETDTALLPHLRTYRRSIELGSSEAIKHAAAEGLGLACLSRWVVADLIALGRLVQVQTTLPRLVRQWHLVMHRDKRKSAPLSRLVALLLRADADHRSG